MLAQQHISLRMKARKADYIDGKAFATDNAVTLPRPPQFQTIYISGGKKTN
jgi:hypothetical protein